MTWTRKIIRHFRLYAPLAFLRDLRFLPRDLLAAGAAGVLIRSRNQVLRSQARPLLRIDSPATRSRKFLLDLAYVEYKLDVTGMRAAKIPMAADMRSRNRGPLVIGAAWHSGYKKKIIEPTAIAKSGDYRYVTHETIRLMFCEGVDWRKTPEYEALQAQLLAGRKPYGLETLNDLEQRGRELVSLYKSISEEGVKPAEDVGRPPWDDVHFYLDETGEVGMGRHANHRFAIARLVGLRWVPAILGGLHVHYAAQFDAEREKVREVSLSNLVERGIIQKLF